MAFPYIYPLFQRRGEREDIFYFRVGPDLEEVVARVGEEEVAFGDGELLDIVRCPGDGGHTLFIFQREGNKVVLVQQREVQTQLRCWVVTGKADSQRELVSVLRVNGITWRSVLLDVNRKI